MPSIPNSAADPALPGEPVQANAVDARRVPGVGPNSSPETAKRQDSSQVLHEAKNSVPTQNSTAAKDSGGDTDEESTAERPLIGDSGKHSGCFCVQCIWSWWGCCGGQRHVDSEAEEGSMPGPSGTGGGGGGSGPGMLRAVGLMFAWYFFSMGLSLYNKFLIGEKHGHFPAPLLMTTFHFLLQYALSTFLLSCVCTSWAPTTRLACRDYNLRIIPTAMATALDIGLSNLSLAFITLTFYTMCKSSAPVFLLLFAFLFRLEALSCRLFGVMTVISIGVLFTVAGETHFQLVGFLLVMGSSVTSGLRWVLIQVLLQKDKLGLTNPLVTLQYLTPVMALVCACFSLLHEPWHMLHKSPFFDTAPHAMRSALIMVLGGILAFFMILAEFLLVLETSAVTFSVAGTVKEGATILVSHLVFGDRFTRINLVGIFIILLGVSLFNIYRSSKHGHGQRDVKQLLPGARSLDEGSGAEDKQQLLSPQQQVLSPDLPPHPSPRNPQVAHSTALERDKPEVVIATSVEPQQQQQHQQQRITSPHGPSSESPRLRVELVQRPSLPLSHLDKWQERLNDAHGE